MQSFLSCNDHVHVIQKFQIILTNALVTKFESKLVTEIINALSFALSRHQLETFRLYSLLAQLVPIVFACTLPSQTMCSILLFPCILKTTINPSGRRTALNSGEVVEYIYQFVWKWSVLHSRQLPSIFVKLLFSWLCMFLNASMSPLITVLSTIEQKCRASMIKASQNFAAFIFLKRVRMQQFCQLMPSSLAVCMYVRNEFHLFGDKGQNHTCDWLKNCPLLF